MVRRMTDKKEFTCNDKGLATFLKRHGVRFIEFRNGRYVFEYNDSIEDIIGLFEDEQDKCMF